MLDFTYETRNDATSDDERKKKILAEPAMPHIRLQRIHKTTATQHIYYPEKGTATHEMHINAHDILEKKNAHDMKIFA